MSGTRPTTKRVGLAYMLEAMGEDGFREWGTNLGQTYRGVESYTLRRRPDMDVR